MTEISDEAQRMLGLLEEALAGTEKLIEGVEPGEWSAPTPCEDWNVHELVEHLVSGLNQFADAASGKVNLEAQTHFPAEEARLWYDHAGDRLLSVWGEPGVADETYEMPWGETPGIILLGFMFIEQLGHGWDLAKGSRQEPLYDDHVVEAALALAQDYDDEAIRVPGMFGPIVSIDPLEPAIDRLAAFQGRNPAVWPH